MPKAICSVAYQPAARPRSAVSMAGASASAQASVPYRSSAIAKPATAPGTATASGPIMLRSPATRGQTNSASSGPSSPLSA